MSYTSEQFFGGHHIHRRPQHDLARFCWTGQQQIFPETISTYLALMVSMVWTWAGAARMRNLSDRVTTRNPATIPAYIHFISVANNSSCWTHLIWFFRVFWYFDNFFPLYARRYCSSSSFQHIIFQRIARHFFMVHKDLWRWRDCWFKRIVETIVGFGFVQGSDASLGPSRQIGTSGHCSRLIWPSDRYVCTPSKSLNGFLRQQAAECRGDKSHWRDRMELLSRCNMMSWIAGLGRGLLQSMHASAPWKFVLSSSRRFYTSWHLPYAYWVGRRSSCEITIKHCFRVRVIYPFLRHKIYGTSSVNMNVIVLICSSIERSIDR